MRRTGWRDNHSCQQDLCFRLGNIQSKNPIKINCFIIYSDHQKQLCLSVFVFVKLWRINETTFQFRVFNKQFMGLNYATGNGIDVVAIAHTSSETFQIVRNSDDLSRVRIKAPNGFFLQVNSPLCFLFVFYLLLFQRLMFVFLKHAIHF